MIAHATLAEPAKTISSWFDCTATSVVVNKHSGMAETIPKAVETVVFVVVALPNSVKTLLGSFSFSSEEVSYSLANVV